MHYTRTTLKRAQEITATVDEAEKIAQEAWRRCEEILQRESSSDDQAGADGHDRRATGGSPATDGYPKPEGGIREGSPADGSAVARKTHLKQGGGGGPSLAAEMTREIESSVMWVQQLLEFVSMAEKD